MILIRNTKVLENTCLCHFGYHKSQGISNSENSVAVIRYKVLKVAYVGTWALKIDDRNSGV
jgi:hypothetical protein